VLNSNEIVQRASDAAHVRDTTAISIDSAVHPGSAYYDATVSGPNEADVAAISRALPLVASRYVDQSYQGYDLETLGTTSATDHSFPPSPAVVTLSVLLGALLGVLLVFIEWIARRLQLIGDGSPPQPVTLAAEAVLPEPDVAPASRGAAEPVAATKADDPALVSESTSPLKSRHRNTVTTRTVEPTVEGDLAPRFEPNIALDVAPPVPAKRSTRTPRATKSRTSARVGAKTAGTRTHKPSLEPVAENGNGDGAMSGNGNGNGATNGRGHDDTDDGSDGARERSEAFAAAPAEGESSTDAPTP
jgi:hypothetical protein